MVTKIYGKSLEVKAWYGVEYRKVKFLQSGVDFGKLEECARKSQLGNRM